MLQNHLNCMHFFFKFYFLPVPAEGDELPASQPLSQFKPNSMPTVVRAHAVITLGLKHLQINCLL